MTAVAPTPAPTQSDVTVDHVCDSDPFGPMLTMSGLGKWGRFGNQIFQYAFLRIAADHMGARVRCAPWDGQAIFGLHDKPVDKLLPPAVEVKADRQTLYDVVPEAIEYLEKRAGGGKRAVRIGAEALTACPTHVDLWGYFQFQTRHYAPHRQFFRELFRPVDDLKAALDGEFDRIRAGRTMVAIHARGTDFATLPLGGFTYVVPVEWWRVWLDKMWPLLDKPLLFVCSDQPGPVVKALSKFSPISARDLNVRIPQRMADMNLDYFTDFYALTLCDVAAISNSSFGFAACMLNERATRFFRPRWNAAPGEFEPFDPWDAEPLLYVRPRRFTKTLPQALAVARATQGFGGMLKCAFIHLPRNFALLWGTRLVLAIRARGIGGLLRRRARA